VGMDFLFIANNLGIDLLNTEVMLQGVPVDLLGTAENLAGWFKAAGFGSLRGSSESLARIHRLRSTIRRCCDKLIESTPLTQADLDSLNEVSNKTRFALLESADGYVLTPQATDELEAIALIARRTCELIASPQIKSLRKCASDKCVLYFVDVSKNQHRQWCSMELCGNRQKSSKHYRKVKST
jgi:predicted RNA-binding Zn ribbon-like protein